MAEIRKKKTKENGLPENAANGTENGNAKSGGQEAAEYDLMSVEETFEALENLIDSLEAGKGSLEDAFNSYEEGMKLIKSCSGKIDRIEKQVLILSGEQTEEEEDVVYFK